MEYQTSLFRGQPDDEAVKEIQYFEKMPTREIARLLRKEVETIQRTLCRIRAKLRGCIRRRLNYGGNSYGGDSYGGGHG